jgi:acyl-CoA synthetase (AMP-forming)/AMP-acid ligase II
MEIEAVPGWVNLGAMLADSAGRHGDLTAVIDGELRLSHAALHVQARALAKALIASGVACGDLVACWAPNGWRGVVLAHAIWLAGGVILPISSRLKILEAGPILERTGAGILFTVAECAGARFLESLAPSPACRAFGPWSASIWTAAPGWESPSTTSWISAIRFRTPDSTPRRRPPNRTMSAR